MLCTPVGERRCIYCDSTASGRALSFIEDYIRHEVLPLYANTHTTASHTGFQTTALRHEARDLVAQAVGASKERDCVLFCGAGATGAVQKLVHLLGVREWAARARLGRLARLLAAARGAGDDGADGGTVEASVQGAMEELATSVAQLSPGGEPGCGGKARLGLDELRRAPDVPVVLVGRYAHHSSILPWREAGAQVEMLPESATAAGVDLPFLRSRLQQLRDEEQQAAADQDRPRHRRLLVGVFSAASNVSGLQQQTGPATQLMHSVGGLALWDFAAAGPHAPIQVNGPEPLDAVYFSPHKFYGGVGTPGVLVVKRSLLCSTCPSAPGGGTVTFVHRDGTPLYHGHQHIEDREEGGTPDIVGSIRCGLTMRLHASVGAAAIELRERTHLARALRAFRAHPNIAVVGDDAGRPLSLADRICIVSLAFPVGAEAGASPLGLCGGRLLLHPGLVSTALSDLFGIQTRAGCMCAGPYGHHLLGMGEPFVRQLLANAAVLRPGYARLSLPYHMPRATVDFVIRAVCWVASNARGLLSCYRADRSGDWAWAAGEDRRGQSSLHAVAFDRGMLSVKSEPHPVRPARQWSCPSAATAGPVPDERPQAEVSRRYPLSEGASEEGGGGFEDLLGAAERLVAAAQPAQSPTRQAAADTASQLLSAEGTAYRWFALPGDAVEVAAGGAVGWGALAGYSWEAALAEAGSARPTAASDSTEQPSREAQVPVSPTGCTACEA